jgi:hypothetical protein
VRTQVDRDLTTVDYFDRLLGLIKNLGRHRWILEFNLRRSPPKTQFHPQPHYPSIPLLDVQEDYWEDEGDKGDRHGVELALLGINCQAADRPLIPYDQPMVLSGDSGSGCYLSMLAISLRPGITRNPEHLLRGTPLGFEYLKQGEYISGY